MNVSLIIAAGGAGKRFLKDAQQKKAPSKLFYCLNGKPLLAHTLESFREIPQIREILLAIPRGTQSKVRNEILKGYKGAPVRLIRGGSTRAESVWNALSRTSARNEWVLVHDGARPFPPREAVQKLFRESSNTDGIILARPVVPTLKRVSSEKNQILETVDRTGLFEAETPQLVRRSVLLKAYRENPKAFLATDESSLVESVGGRIKVLSHSNWNVKVTTLEDLRMAQAYYASRGVSSVTIGFGRDTHRLVEGRKLYLGSVRIPFQKGALGHSDGDALLHAVSDAVLGAIGSGDIGDWFSDRNPRFKNIRSEKILLKVLGEARRKSWVIDHVDSVIILEKPRLGPYKKLIRKKMARLLGMQEEEISIKAKTQEGLGPEGGGLAVTCEALVLMRRSP